MQTPGRLDREHHLRMPTQRGHQPIHPATPSRDTGTDSGATSGPDPSLTRPD